MIAIDTNVLVTLWQPESHANRPAREVLRQMRRQGPLVLSAPAFAELRAGPGRTDDFLNALLNNTGITVDWKFSESLWREAGKNYQVHRFGVKRSEPPRRILADFLIATHAARCCGRLLSFDRGMGQLGISGLQVLVPQSVLP